MPNQRQTRPRYTDIDAGIIRDLLRENNHLITSGGQIVSAAMIKVKLIGFFAAIKRNERDNSPLDVCRVEGIDSNHTDCTYVEIKYLTGPYKDTPDISVKYSDLVEDARRKLLRQVKPLW